MTLNMTNDRPIDRAAAPPSFLDCGHVEHPQASGFCQTVGCPNQEPPTSVKLYEWASVLSVGVMVWGVHHVTDRYLVEIILSNLPDLFT